MYILAYAPALPLSVCRGLSRPIILLPWKDITLIFFFFSAVSLFYLSLCHSFPSFLQLCRLALPSLFLTEHKLFFVSPVVVSFSLEQYFKGIHLFLYLRNSHLQKLSSLSKPFSFHSYGSDNNFSLSLSFRSSLFFSFFFSFLSLPFCISLN